MFSVIIPLHNKKDYVSKAINSVLNQDFNEYELIIVDDGSTDKPLEVIGSIFDQKRIIYHYQPNSGVSCARNKGVELSKFQYLCFLDSDDYWEPNHLSSLKRLIELYPNCGLYATRYRRVFGSKTEIFPSLKAESVIYDDLFKALNKSGEEMIHTNSVCIPKKVFKEIGGFMPGEKIGEDTSLWYRIACFNSICFSSNVTTNYIVDHSDTLKDYSNPRMKEQWSFFSFYETIKDNVKIPNKKKKSIDVFMNRYFHSLARNYLLIGDRASAKKFYKKTRFCFPVMHQKIITLICFLVPQRFLRKTYSKYRNLD